MIKNARHSDEQGIAHLLLAVLFVVVIAGIGLAGWRVATMSRSSSTNSTGSNTTTANSSHANNTSNSGSNSSSVEAQCLAMYHDGNLCHFAVFSTSIEKMAYTATLTSTQDGTTSSMTLKQDGKGNNELTTTAEGQTVSTVTYNGTMYMRSDSSSPWVAYPSGSGAPAAEDPANKMDFALSNVGITFKSLGTERCGSLTCFKYQVNDKATPNVTQYVWFDNSSYKLREWQYNEGGNSLHMALSYDNVAITAPSPVQPL